MWNIYQDGSGDEAEQVKRDAGVFRVLRLPASPLGRERIEVRHSSALELNTARNPHPTLSLGKGEAGRRSERLDDGSALKSAIPFGFCSGPEPVERQRTRSPLIPANTVRE